MLMISVTRLATYVFSLRGLPVSQPSTIVLSVQRYVSVRGMSSISLACCINLVTVTAPQSSSLGIVSFLMGATFVFAATRETWCCPDNRPHEDLVTKDMGARPRMGRSSTRTSVAHLALLEVRIEAVVAARHP